MRTPPHNGGMRSVATLFAFATCVTLAVAQDAFWTRGLPFSVELGRDGWAKPSATVTAPGFHGPITLDFSGLRREGDQLSGRFRFVSAGHSLCGLRMDVIGVSESRADGERAYPAAGAVPLFLGDAAEERVTIEIPDYSITGVAFSAETKSVTIRGVLSGWTVGPDLGIKAREAATCLNNGANGRFWLGGAELDLTAWTLDPIALGAMLANGPGGGVWHVTPDGKARLVGRSGEGVEVAVGPNREQRQVRTDDNGHLVVGSDNGTVRKIRGDGTVEWQAEIGGSGAMPITTGPKARVYAVRKRDGAVELVAIEDNGATVRIVTTSRSTGHVRIQAPVAIRTDPTGYLHALDRRRDSFEVRVFDPFGKIVRSTGHMGAFRGREAREPLDLAFGEDGTMLVLFKNAAGDLFIRPYRPF